MQEQHSFGYWLRLKRKALDLTREALADRVGCSLSTIRKLEDEERHPSAQIAELLADIFKIPTTERTAFFNLRAATGDLLPARETKKPPGASQHQKFPIIPVRIYRQPLL